MRKASDNSLLKHGQSCTPLSTALALPLPIVVGSAPITICCAADVRHGLSHNQEGTTMRIRHVLVSVLTAWALTAGCAQPPADQINAAEQAVKDAQQSGAATYVANDYAKIEGLMAATKQEVADQDAKFALLRDYGKAEQLAATTKAEAERVKADAT